MYALLQLQKMQEASSTMVNTSQALIWNSEYLSPGPRFDSISVVSSQIILILRTKLGASWPIEKKYITAFSKYYLSYRVRVGSVLGLRKKGDIRDDSYIKWLFTYLTGREQIRYRRVQIYL